VILQSVLGLSPGKNRRCILVSEMLACLDETKHGIDTQLREAALAVPIIQRIPFTGYLCPETTHDEGEAPPPRSPLSRNSMRDLLVLTRLIAALIRLSVIMECAFVLAVALAVSSK
jgi:hypothetical protein